MTDQAAERRKIWGVGGRRMERARRGWCSERCVARRDATGSSDGMGRRATSRLTRMLAILIGRRRRVEGMGGGIEGWRRRRKCCRVAVGVCEMEELVGAVRRERKGEV